MKPVRVLIVADDSLARAGLAALLSDVPELVVVGRVAAADDLATALEAHEPDAILWDTGWKPESALERLAETPKTRPIIALVNDEADARNAWRAGAVGLLPRNTSPERLAVAAAAVSQGMAAIELEYREVLSTEAKAVPPSGSSLPDAEPLLVEELTPRELEVLRLLAEGLPNKTIAQRLDISEHTVKFHVNALLGKLGVGSRTEAVVRATRLGLIFL